MWELYSCITKEDIETYLRAGFEPFAITMEPQGERVWLKKWLQEMVTVNKPETVGSSAEALGRLNETIDKPAKPVKGTGRWSTLGEKE